MRSSLGSPNFGRGRHNRPMQTDHRAAGEKTGSEDDEAPKLRRSQAEYLATRTADLPTTMRRRFICRRCQGGFIKGEGVPDPQSGLGKCNSCLAASP